MATQNPLSKCVSFQLVAVKNTDRWKHQSPLAKRHEEKRSTTASPMGNARIQARTLFLHFTVLKAHRSSIVSLNHFLDSEERLLYLVEYRSQIFIEPKNSEPSF